MPFISFIVPVYNIMKYLPTCMESIVSQPFGDWEIILVDDKSNDGSECLCDRYAAADARITCAHMSTNVGPGMARNEGLLRATGDYVFFLDGDDAIAAGELPKLWETIGKSGFPDMMRVGYAESFGRIPEANAAGYREAKESVCSVEDFLRPLLRNSRVGFRAWEFVMKKSMLLNLGLEFSPSRVWEDNDFIMRSLFAGNRIGEYGRVFYHWRTRLSGTLTSAHITWWDQIVKSAAAMLEFACGKALSDLQKEWALRSVHSCVVEFEAIAGAVSAAEVIKQADLFLPFENYMLGLKEYIIENGLLWHINTLGARQGAVAFCRQKAEEACALLYERTGRELFGFPATRKCSRLLGVLSANGYEFKGMLDNDPKKQGLMLDGRVVFSPEIIPLCYDDDSKLFVIISTSTRRTGAALADQLRGYGLEEDRHFICTGFAED